MGEIRILYVTKLKNSMANGVTVAVSQLLNSMCKKAKIGWLDIGETSFDFDIDESVVRLLPQNWESFDPDIAVFEDPFNSLTFTKIAKRLHKRNIPYILSPHGCFVRIALQKKRAKKYIAMHTVLRRYLKKSYATQYLCENEKNNSVLFGIPVLIPNGIPAAEEYKKVGEIKKIVFLSRKDVNNKGLDYLLEALASKKELLMKKAIKVELYGTAESLEDEEFISAYIKKNGLAEIVSNNGPVFGSEKTAVLLDSDLFVLTSRHEGFPMSVLEALSFGLPVLVTKGTNMDDIVEQANAGWTCETNAAAIGEKLEQALTCADCSQISRNARKLSMEYSWDAIAQLTVEKYLQIIGNTKKKNDG